MIIARITRGIRSKSTTLISHPRTMSIHHALRWRQLEEGRWCQRWVYSLLVSMWEEMLHPDLHMHLSSLVRTGLPMTSEYRLHHQGNRWNPPLMMLHSLPASKLSTVWCNADRDRQISSGKQSDRVEQMPTSINPSYLHLEMQHQVSLTTS